MDFLGSYFGKASAGLFMKETGGTLIGMFQSTGSGDLNLGLRFNVVCRVTTYNGMNGGTGVILATSGSLMWSSVSSAQNGPDTAISRRAAANIQFGGQDIAAPVAQKITPQSVIAGTSNTAGADFTFQGSASTGSASGGKLIFQVTPAGSAGSAQNGWTTLLTIDPATGIIHAAGTISRAALKFTSGSLLTTQTAGAWEWDGTDLYYTPSSSSPARRKVAYQDQLTSGGALTGSATIDGAGKESVTTSVSDSNVTTSSIIMCSVTTDTGYDLDELELEPVQVFGSCAANGTLTLMLVAANPMTAHYKVRYALL